MVEEEGLTLSTIEDNPPMDHLRFGAAGAEEEFEQVCQFAENLGKLGVSIWRYIYVGNYQAPLASVRVRPVLECARLRRKLGQTQS